jgi:hypothetical protein
MELMGTHVENKEEDAELLTIFASWRKRVARK